MIAAVGPSQGQNAVPGQILLVSWSERHANSKYRECVRLGCVRSSQRRSRCSHRLSNEAEEVKWRSPPGYIHVCCNRHRSPHSPCTGGVSKGGCGRAALNAYEHSPRDIAGASSGIGFAIAEDMLHRGYQFGRVRKCRRPPTTE
jgi:hypothetical protein